MSELASGHITQVIGPVVDVEFPPGALPELLTALRVSNKSISDKEDNLVLEVATAPRRGHGPRHRHGHDRRSGPRAWR